MYSIKEQTDLYHTPSFGEPNPSQSTEANTHTEDPGPRYKEKSIAET